MRNKPTLISMIAVISSAVVFFSAQTVFAATFTVTNTNDAGAGSLRQAILDANAAAGNDVIEFDSSFSVPRTITLSSRITVTGNGGLTLNGPGPDLLTITGIAGTRLFELSGFGAPNIGAIVFNDLTLADANCTSSQCGTGAAIGTNGDNTGTGEIPATINFTANNLVFRNNNAGVNLGGGIAFRRTVASINDSTFTRNTSNGGTAISAITNTVLTINNSSFFENTRNGGDNVVLVGGTASSVVIANSAIFNNGNPTASAAVRIGSAQAGDHSITNTTIANNIGVFAGVSYDTNNNQISLTLTNVTIAGNRSPSGNTAAGFNSANINIVNVRNTIIANNFNPNGPADLGDGPSSNFNSQGHNLIESIYSGTIQGDTTGNLIGVDPWLDGLMRDNGGPTKTMALRTGSPAINAGDPATFPPTDQRGIARPQDGDGTGGAVSDIGAYERRTTDSVAAAPFDIDGDGKTDVSIYRPTVGEWWWRRSSDTQVPALQFGTASDVVTPGDFTGDEKMDIAFFRPSDGLWAVLRSNDWTFYAYPFGTAGDVPVVGDYDGDGRSDTAVFRQSNSTWFIRRSGDGGTTIASFGSTGDVPVAGDYDGDGTDDIAIYRPNGATGGEWWISRSTAGTFVTQFGNATDKTVPGDYTGDGKTDIAFWRPSTVGSSRVDLQACKLEYSIVSPK